jgi:hypothetical protein
LPAALRNRLLRLAAFQNPEFYRAQAMRLPTFGKPRIISCAEEHPLHIGLPRGCLDETRICSPASASNASCATSATRRAAERHVPRYLAPQQLVAARRAWLAHDQGVLAATTAFGKTVVAAWLIARAASARWSSCTASNSWSSGSNDCRASWACRPARSGASAAAATSPTGRSTWR